VADTPPLLNHPAVDATPLAAQALDNLVHQFARPLDFLRELVQNALDAGTPRVDVRLEWTPTAADSKRGVLAITVADSGSGMDEAIIDHQLTAMFASSKEDDLTKIGKFGIGFTSIFAIRPQAVLLRTGRHGQFWELYFHPDRSFDKVRVTEPIAGTTVTLYKELPQVEVEPFVREARWVLTHWCRHSSVPIAFWDRTTEPQQQAQATGSDDPFAAFGDTAPSGPELVNSPLALDAELQDEQRVGAIRVLIGWSDTPRLGFFNGGLTLLDTDRPDALGRFGGRFGHLSFKVQSDNLEHTLTRDNVLQDENWEAAMGALGLAAFALRERLIDHVATLAQAAAASGAPADRAEHRRWLVRLVEECRRSRPWREVDKFADRVLLLDEQGQTRSLADVARQEEQVGTVLLAPSSSVLTEALRAEGLFMLQAEPEERALIASWPVEALWGLSRRERKAQAADAVYVLPSLADARRMSPVEAALLSQLSALIEEASGGRLRILLGELIGVEPGADLAVEGPSDGRVFQRHSQLSPWSRRRRKRTLIVNRRHPIWLAWAAASAVQPLAAVGAIGALLLDIGRADDDMAQQLHETLVSQLGDVSA
jgi:Histidine kinase-, DNA gyrase B-, and HSP90-like ATPase